MGLAAFKIHPDRDTEFGLLDTLTTTHYAGTLEGHTSSVDLLAFTPDGRTLASADGNGLVLLWDLSDEAKPRRLGELSTGHSAELVSSLAFAPDGRTLATAGNRDDDTTVELWDLTDRAKPRRLGQPLTTRSAWLGDVAFAPDGRTLATSTNKDDEAGDGTVVIWDLANRHKPRQLGTRRTGLSAGVSELAFAPTGDTLAIGRFGGTVLLWDLANEPSRAKPASR